MGNSSCSKEMENQAKKALKNGVGIIYSLLRNVYYSMVQMRIKTNIDCHINNFTTLSVVGVGVQDFEPLPPLALCQILKSGNYLTIYRIQPRNS